MLARRVIPVLLHDGNGLVKGRGFDPGRRVGFARQAVMVYEARQVDELIFLDIGATPQGREPDISLIRDLADECFMPLTVGGGVRTLEHFRGILANGADKVAICTAAVEEPGLIDRAAEKFGSQAVVVSVDAAPEGIATRCGRQATGLDPVQWAREVESRGAGEILLNSVARDGAMEGYDLDLVARVSEAVGIPVVACGGAGTPEDFDKALNAGASAVAAGAIFHFTETTPALVKRHLADKGHCVRL